MQVDLMPVERLVPYARNARTHSEAQVAQIAASIREFGFTNPVLIRDDLSVIAGHGRLLAARKLGMEAVPCIRLSHLTPTQARAYVIADNRLAEQADWDLEVLAAEIEDLRLDGFDIDLTGFDAGALDELFDAEAGGTEGLTDPDDAPKPQAEAVTKPGDVWLLGRHRVMCGDSMEREDIARLYTSGKVEYILTDPPYCSGGFQESKRTAGSTEATNGPKIARDNLTTEGLAALIEGAIGRLPCDGACYVFCDWRQIFAVRKAVEPLGYQYRALLVWDKNTPGMGGPWRHQYEMCFFGTKRKEPSTGKSGDVLRVNRSGNQHHTTEKPVELLVSIIENTVGDSVADPFSGSGTTIIAAEQTGRACYAMELSPQYVDVAVRRWQAFTGKTATLESTGEPFPG